ncbi:hypothetical protein [Bacillus sp. AFS040349]|uniref:hypothetical protein n=1 Tax=Bacillus sp. AFS040349 TaxID=2033502 RepID=UPI000BFD2876|nr:hypothetical protein [Bacillus sp. AFS040349]PGT83291.1 hypothetical protein COD11_13225 [Bacillus sp. AFS040349]
MGNFENVHISQMEDNESYKLVVVGRSSEYSLVKKEGEKIEVSYIGGDFGDAPQTVTFNLSIIYLIEGFETVTLEELTIGLLEEVSVCIYTLVLSNGVPEKLKGKIHVDWL